MSENPLEHWSDITNLEGKIVLDFGCGWLFQPFQSTTEYFISRGASLVVGVDVACSEIEQLKERYPQHSFFCQKLETLSQIDNYITTYRPQVIKMDIEGVESVLKDVQAEDWSSVEEVAIEYHNPECKKIITNKLTELGFTIFAINPFGWYVTNPNIMGVLHAKR
jgi:hypothetical protein